MSVKVSTTTNTIVVQNANQTITVVDNENTNIVNVTQPLVNVIEVASPGPQGPVGPQGPSVPFVNIGNDIYATTSSLQVTGSFTVSGSSTFTNIGPAVFSGSVNATSGVTMSSALVSGNVTVLGTASINVLQINTTINSTGSNQLGDAPNDTQTLYGSVIIPTGSLTVSGALDVSGSARIKGTITLETTGITTYIFPQYTDVYGSNYSFNTHGAYYTRFWSQDTGYLTFWTAATEKMRVFNTGNVLIQDGGTFTDAGYRLDVSGSVKISNGIFGVGTTGTILPLANTAGTGTIVLGGTSPNTPAVRIQGSPINVNIGSTQVGQFFATTGNFTLQNGGTFTDAGFRLDVNGTARVQGEANVSFLSLSGNTAVNNSGTTMILGASGGWAGVRVPRYFETTGSISAASAIARGTYLNQTLVATANNDVLVGLDIASTFTTGSFTGTTLQPIRIRNAANNGNVFSVDSIGNTVMLGSLNTNSVYGSSVINLSSGGGNLRLQTNFTANTGLTMFQNTRNIVIQDGGTFTDNNYRLQVYATGSTDSGSLFVGGTTIATGSIARTMLISSSLSASANNDVLVGLDIAPTFTNGAFTGVQQEHLVIRGGNNPLIRFKDSTGATTWAQFGGNASELSFNAQAGALNFVAGNTQAMYVFASTRNVLIQNGGTLTDRGYRLDVSGSGNFSNNLTVTGSITTGVANSANGTVTINRTGGPVGLIIRGSDGNIVGAGNAPVYEPYNYADASHNFNIGHASSGNYNWFVGTNATLNLNTQLMRLTRGGNLLIGTTTDSGRLAVRGSGATSATTTFLLQNSTPTNLLTVLDNGQVSFTSPTMSLAASQSAFSISPIISASNIVGGQYYGVNITPTFFQTTGSQTETAFRVAATFTSSNATATSGSNIIADFGSTSAGSQLTVTDVTSGSIYMVNDVSGIPIIEATSNWDVNMYDFPNKIFEKTGSQVNIYGTMRVSGSFILPLSQSATPQTGSAYWSGSLLFIYDGTRYRSSSFA